jgi:hypothetical protein
VPSFAKDKPPDVGAQDTKMPVVREGKVAAPAVVAGPAPTRTPEADKAATGRRASDDEQVLLAGARDGETKGASEDARASRGDAKPAVAAKPKALRKLAVDEKAREVSDSPASAPAQPSGAAGSGELAKKNATGQDRAPESPSAGAAAQPSAPVVPPPPTDKLAAAPPRPARGGDLKKADSAVAAAPAPEPRTESAAGSTAPAKPAAEPPPPPAQETQADADQRAQTQAESAPQAKEATPAKEPPEQQLYRQAQKEAAGGRCASALTLTGKIAKMNPEFYRRRVAGDPTLQSCSAPARTKAKAPAKQERPLEDVKDATAVDKAAK